MGSSFSLATGSNLIGIWGFLRFFQGENLIGFHIPYYLFSAIGPTYLEISRESLSQAKMKSRIIR